MRSKTGAMMKAVKKSAKPTITCVGGVCGDPTPCLKNDSTTTVRTNEVVVSTSAGNSDSMVRTSRILSEVVSPCPPSSCVASASNLPPSPHQTGYLRLNAWTVVAHCARAYTRASLSSSTAPIGACAHCVACLPRGYQCGDFRVTAEGAFLRTLATAENRTKDLIEPGAGLTRAVV